MAGADFDAYREFYGLGADVFQDAPTFSARVRAWRLPGVLLFARRLSGVRHDRPPERLAADGFDHFTLQIVRGGFLSFGDDRDGWTTLGEGAAILFDMRRPMGLRFDDAHLLSASIARDLVVTAAGRDDLHRHRLAPDAAATLRDRLAAFDVEDGAPEPAGAEAARLLPPLLDLLVGAGSRESGAARRRRVLAQRLLITTFIEAQLGRRDLQAARIASACGVSRATLYRLTTPDGGVATLIRKRRLARLERHLADGADSPALHELAHVLGFADENLMSRQFRRSAGVSPGRYRRRVRDDAAHAAARSRWAVWMAELN